MRSHSHARGLARALLPAPPRGQVCARARTALLGALIAATAALSGCSSDGAAPADAGQPRHGGEVVVGLTKEPPILNQWLAEGGMAVTDAVVDPLGDPFVRVDPDGRWEPVLATTVPTAANGGVRVGRDGRMVVRFSIQPAATWSDGFPITCADLRFTWRTAVDPRWMIGSRLGWEQIEDVRCPSPRSVEVHFAEPYAPYLSTVLAMAPLPAHELQGKDFNTYWNSRITVSSGPFMFESWRRGVQVVLARNPHYWRSGSARLPRLDRLVFRFVPDANTMKLQLRMGELDVASPTPDSNLGRELESIDITGHDLRAGAGWEQIGMQVRRPHLADRRVRQAIAMSIDRQLIADVVLDGQVEVLQSPVPPRFAALHRPTFARYLPNPAEAAALMRAAGYEQDGERRWSRAGAPVVLVLKTTSGHPLRAKIAQLVQAQLRAAGFGVELTVEKPDVFFASSMTRGEYDLAIWASGTDADPTISRLFACSEIARPPNFAGKNNYHYCNPTLDRQLAIGDRAVVAARRSAAFHEIQRIIGEDVPVLPLYQLPDALVWNERVRGARWNSTAGHLWNVEDWWVVE